MACTETNWTTKNNTLTGVDLTRTVRISGTFTIGYQGLLVGFGDDTGEVGMDIQSYFEGHAAELYWLNYEDFDYTQVEYLLDAPFAPGDSVRFMLCWDAVAQTATGKVELVTP